MTFRSPWLLVLLVVIPGVVAAYMWARRWRGRRMAGLAAQGLRATDPGKRRYVRQLPFALFMLALAVLIVAIAQPMATIATPKRQATVVLAIDVSNSMAATDVKPSRLGAAKAVAEAFVRRQPSGVKIGVVAFGQNAVIVQRPTTGHASTLQAINRLSLGGGTTIAQGILTSLDAIAGKTIKVNEKALASQSANVNIGFYGGATIVLLSDGENTSQTSPVPLAQLASVAGVHIQTVGVGTAAGTTVKIDGFSIGTALDPSTMQSMAKVAGGSYYQASNSSAVTAISKTINLHLTMVKQHTEIAALFAMAGILLLIVGAVIAVFRLGRVV
jgi:Ca-activated chloride channel homolog